MKQSLDHLYHEIRSRLAARYSAGEASAVAFALLDDVYGASRTDVLRGKDKDFSAQERNELDEMLQKLSQGLPLQYATGRALFADRYFRVSPDVLIPRPETEAIPQLVAAAATRVAAGSDAAADGATTAGAGARPVRCLDCGTGSGCIAVTIALDHPDWSVEAWDISAAALAVAADNAERLGATGVTFAERDILAEAARLSSVEGAGTSVVGGCTGAELYDFIVSNPPYICDREAAEMEAHVLDHEPHTALFVPDDDPLVFYRALAAIGRALLTPGGCMVVECNRAFTRETAALMGDYGFVDVEVIADCFDAPRFVRGFRPAAVVL